MTADVDLGAITRGEAGSLVLTRRAVRAGGAGGGGAAGHLGKGADQESAFIPATGRIEERPRPRTTAARPPRSP
ncbi:DUF5719 family protein [Streptomyces sp. M19]